MSLATPETLRELAPRIRDAPWVALDTEFHAERRHHPRLLLVQVLVPDAGIYLIDPLDTRALPQVAEALRETPWVLHAGRQDLRLLCPVLGGVPEEVFDTQVAAGLCTPVYPAAYSDLVGQFLDETVSKSATMSDWSRRPLGTEQLRYAADDVRLLPRLREALQKRLTDLGRLDLVSHANREARDSAIDSPDPRELWRELGATAFLDDSGVRVARALAAWRYTVAVESDQPARSILSDGLLMDLARRQPATINRILSNRRFPRRLAQRLGDQLIELIRHAVATEDTPTRIPANSRESRLRLYVQAVVNALGAQHHWSQRLVLPEPTLDELVLAHAHGSRLPPLTAWREALVGDLFRALVDGAPIRVDGPKIAI